MSGNRFGTLFQYTTFGESHGPAIGAVVDGVPPRIPLDESYIQHFLDQRKPGQSKYTTQRKEPDRVEILSGVFEGYTTGTPIGLLIHNSDQKSKDYGDIKDKFRPGHADYTYHEKYGIRDYRGGGRSSARETAMRVAAGAIARKVLKYDIPRTLANGVNPSPASLQDAEPHLLEVLPPGEHPNYLGHRQAHEKGEKKAHSKEEVLNPEFLMHEFEDGQALSDARKEEHAHIPLIRAAVVQIGHDKIDRENWDWSEVTKNPLWCPDPDAVERWQDYLQSIRKKGSSVGAIVEVHASAIPPGLGAPVYDKLDADLAKAMMSINAVKAVEIGNGFDSVVLGGEDNADEIRTDENGNPVFLSNKAGGILGGISSGQDIVMRVAFKPTSSILIPRQTIDAKGHETEIITKGRHDPCVGLRGTPVVEAMMACVLADHWLRHKAQCL
ncbi:MAG: chorismate synthase [Alphaproteobacteria bacterium]